MPSLSDESLLTDLAATLGDPGPMPAGLDAAHKALFPVVPDRVTVTRYRCRFCRRYSRSKPGPVADHMTRCWRNPAVRACKTCAHHQEAAEPDVGLSGFEWCDAQDVELDGIRDHCPLWALRGSAEADGGAD